MEGTKIIQKAQQQYLEARDKAFNLEKTLEDAQYQCIEEIRELVNKIQKKYLIKYETEIAELDKLHFGIQQIQARGRMELNRKLKKIYCEAENENSEDTRKKIQQVITDFKKLYFPNDQYQKKRDEQANRLKNAILQQFQSTSTSHRGSPEVPYITMRPLDDLEIEDNEDMVEDVDEMV